MTTLGADAEAAFERDIPQDLWEDIRIQMCEAAHDDRYENDCVRITERDRLNVINVRVSGVVRLNGREFSFILESGDRNGDVLLGWEEAGTQELEHHVPTKWSLAPKPDLVNKAIASGQGPFLVIKWDAFLTRPGVSDIPRKYSYDRFFQPGGQVEDYWKNAASEHGFVLVTDDHANEIRKRLAAATTPYLDGGAE